MENTNINNNSEGSKINTGLRTDGDKLIATTEATICTGDEIVKPENNERTNELDVEPFDNQSSTLSVNHQSNRSTSETTTQPCSESSNPGSPEVKSEFPCPQQTQVTGQEPYILYSEFQNTGATICQPLTLPTDTQSIEKTSDNKEGSETVTQPYLLYYHPQNTVTKILKPLVLPVRTQLTGPSVNQPHISSVPNIPTNPQSTGIEVLQLTQLIGSAPILPLVLGNNEVTQPDLLRKESKSHFSEGTDLKAALTSKGGADREWMDIRTLKIGDILALTGLSQHKDNQRGVLNFATQRATSDRSSQLCDENELLENEIKPALLYGSEPESNEDSDEEDWPKLKASHRITHHSESSDSDEDDEESTSILPSIKLQLIKSYYGIKAVIPNNLFDFQWCRLPSGHRSHDPYQKKENFLLTPGPTETFSSPYDAFTSIWDSQIMAHIVERTNRNASNILNESGSNDKRSTSNNPKSWQETDVDEMYAFLAANVACGFVNNSEDIWSVTGSIVDTPNISNYLPYNRYTMIFKHLDYSDESFDDATSHLNCKEINIDTIKPVIDHLNLKFQSLYVMDRDITINEISTAWKTKSAIDQFTKSAPLSGLRMHEVCETKTGYMWRFEVNSSDQETSTEESTPLGTVRPMMLRLVKDLEYKGYTLWLDKLYTNPALVRRLKSIGFDVVGVMCKRLLPNQLRKLSNMRRNEVFGCTSGDINILVWREKGLRVVTSTYHNDALSTGECLSVKPMAVLDYESCMKAVYSRNRLLAPFLVHERTKKGLHLKFFRWLLNMSIFNSYVLYTRSNGNTRIVKFKIYRLKLIDELFARHGRRDVSPEVPIKCIYRNKAIFTERVKEHFPKFFSEECRSSVAGKPKCVVCKKYTVIFCQKCEAKLCLFTCYKTYHSQ